MNIFWSYYTEGLHTQGRRLISNYTPSGDNVHFGGGRIWMSWCCNIWCPRSAFEHRHDQWERCPAQVGGWINGYHVRYESRPHTKHMVKRWKESSLFEDYGGSIWMHWMGSPLLWPLCEYFKRVWFCHQYIQLICCK